MNREQFMKLIPKPKNQEVIVYDVNLKDLLDVNVFEEYKATLNEYKQKKETYDLLDIEINQYLEIINKAYLYDTSWGESDYINMLQNEKKTYSTLYRSIKQIEDKISISKKKLKVIEEKINIQTITDKKNIEKKLESLDANIEKNKNLYFKQKDKLNELKNDLSYINHLIQDAYKDKEFINKMKEDLKNDTFICEYCGTKIKSHGENSHLAKRIQRNLINNDKQIANLNSRKEKTELEIAGLENEFKKVKEQLNNDIQIKKQGNNIYIKKSTEVLKLEGLRTKTINDITTLEKSLKKQPHYSSDAFNNIKDKISKLELSLDNLHKIKVAKTNIQDKINQYDSLKKELSDIESKLKSYVNFIRIYYKIYEQKLNLLFGNGIKFKLYEIDNYEVKEVLKIYYNNIEYEYLDNKAKNSVNKILLRNLYENI